MGQQQQHPPQFGDTTLTKVFVGGLAWETQKDVLREHFDKYGEILEAVIISDKITGRSKGYGFVTFKEVEAAKKACEEATPVINGRRANCNLASLGARRPPGGKGSPQLQQAGGGSTVVRAASVPAAWYYPQAGAPAQPGPSPFHHQYPGVLPFYAAAAYGYSPPYVVSPDMGYNAKPSHASAGGTYLPSGHFSYQGGMVAPSTMMPVYSLYQFHQHHHQSHSMGVPVAHYFPSVTASTNAVATMPAFISKSPAVPPTTGTNNTHIASGKAFGIEV